MKPEMPRRRRRLTRAQQRLVARAALGQTAKEMARDLEMTPGGVATVLSYARERLGARNTAHLVALAFAYGLIDDAMIRVMTEATR
jgi:DNA-binding CsgD family transcriptional regulator